MKRTITATLISLLFASLCPIIEPSQAQSAPALPQTTVDTTYRQPTGKSIALGAGGDLQAAIDSAQSNDEVVLASGATFVGNFALKSSGIVIRWGESAKLPQGKRVTPADMSNAPKILSPNNMGAFYAPSRVSNIRLVGLDISVSPSFTGTNTGLIRFGDGSESSVAALSSNMIVDRCYIHGTPAGETTRGVALNCGAAAVIDSHISDIHSSGFDSQAIAGWNGTGPFKIVNNYLEAAGENVMFGGEDARAVELIPSDIEFRRNNVFKPLAWRTGTPRWVVKNLFELKDAKRVLVEGNTFYNSWGPVQTYAINIKSANQGGGFGEWSVAEDVTFINNIVAHAGGGITVNGADPDTQQRTKRVRIANNLIYDINGATYAGTGNAFQVTGGSVDTQIIHNTVLATGKIIESDGQPNTGFVFDSNIVAHNDYGVKGSGQGVGSPTLNFYFPGHVFKRNLIIGPDSSLKGAYPADNIFLPSVAFADATTGNYRPTAALPLGTDNTPVGANLDVIEAAMRGGASPGPTSIRTLTFTIEVYSDGSVVVKDASGKVVRL